MPKRTVISLEVLIDAIAKCNSWNQVCKMLKVSDITLKRLVREAGIKSAPSKQTMSLKLALWKIKKDYGGSRDFTLAELAEELDCYFGTKYTENFTTSELKKAWGELQSVRA